MGLLREVIAAISQSTAQCDAPEDEDFIESKEGCQKGENNGSAEFAIGLQLILLGIGERHPGITVSADYDDVQFIGKPFGVAAAALTLTECL